MAQHTENPAIERLAVFVDEWSMAPDFKNGPPADVGAHVVFEWMPGKRFLIQRWEVPTPEAPTASRSSALIRKAMATFFSTTSTPATRSTS